jgi:hypothetical protein
MATTYSSPSRSYGLVGPLRLSDRQQWPALHAVGASERPGESDGQFVRARTESAGPVAACFSRRIAQSMTNAVPGRTLKLRRADVCVGCGTELSAGTAAWWDAEARTVTCLTCHTTLSPSSPALEPLEVEVFARGDAGASLGREYDRRRAKREQRVRAAHPRIGEFLLKWQDAPQHETAFRQGQLAEESVAESLERRAADGPTTLT